MIDEPSAALSDYMREIAQHPLLTADEEIALSRQLHEGRCAACRLTGVKDQSEREELQQRVALGNQARERLISSNLRLVVAVARRYRGHGLSFMDLIQEGNIGLQTGVERYDWRKGYRLSTYVYWWIRQAITRALANDSRAIRLPVHAGELLRRSADIEQRLELELGRAPTLAELAAQTGIEPDRLRALRHAAVLPASLDAPVSHEVELTRGDTIPDETAETALQAHVDANELHDRFVELLNSLPQREREVLQLRYGLDRPESWSLAQIGQHLGVTRERARQIEEQALRRLRDDARLKRDLVDLVAV
jgi:RNA polymerase primary sigma factor